MRALHIGDLHFWRFTVNPLQLAGKRVLGLANLALRRSRAFEQHRASELVSRLKEVNADRYLFSGDFSTTSLQSEFGAAEAALSPLDASKVRAVPGNHDRYTRRDLPPHVGAFDHFLSGYPFHKQSPCPESDAFPWFEECEPGLWVIGLDPTASNGIGCWGELRGKTMEALEGWRNAAGKNAREVWLLCHFPIEDLPGVFHRDRGVELRGGERLLEFLGGLEIPVICLHGHHHFRWVYRSAKSPRVVYLNAGAPLYKRKGTASADLSFHELVRDDGVTSIRTHCMRDTGWTSFDVEMPDPGDYRDLQRL